VLGTCSRDEQRVRARVDRDPNPRHSGGNRGAHLVHIPKREPVGDRLRGLGGRLKLLRVSDDQVRAEPAKRQAVGFQDESQCVFAGHIDQP